MDNTREFTPANERKGLALSGFIMSLIGLFCAFIVLWRMFAIVIALIGLIVAIVSLRKATRAGKSRGMQIASIIIAIAAIVAASYFLYMAPAEGAASGPDKIPVGASQH